MTATKSTKLARKRGRPRHDGPREPSGRPQRDLAEDPRFTSNAAILRHLGQSWLDRYRVTITDPMVRCTVGRVIIVSDMAPDARARLWQAAQHMRATYTRHGALQGFPAPHAKPATLLAPASEVDLWPDAPKPDLRPMSERVTDAEAAWYNLRGVLLALPPRARQDTERAVLRDDTRRIDWPGVMTALRRVADWLDGAPTRRDTAAPVRPRG